MTTKIKIGDVVRLSCGGPTMTVESFTQDGWAVTIWIHGKEKVHAAFALANLVVIPMAGTTSDT